MANTRYIPHSNTLPSDLHTLKDDIKHALGAGLHRVHGHPSSRPGVYVGGAGTLLMDRTLRDFANEYPIVTLHTVDITSFPLLQPDSGGHASFLETSVGTAALVLADRSTHTDTDTHNPPLQVHETSTRLIRDAVRLALAEAESDDGCEVLYGRAGLLYALLFLRSCRTHGQTPGADLGQLCADTTIDPLVRDIVARGTVGAKAYRDDLEVHARDRDKDRDWVPPSPPPPLMWRWHGKRYLGGAHGVAGILQMLVSAPPRIVAPHWEMITGTAQWLLAIQQPSGNWPHKARASGKMHVHGGGVDDEDEGDQLVQWCHGAPAILILLATLIKRFGSLSSLPSSSHPPLMLTLPRATEDAARAALACGGQLVYERGLLRKGVGLCHGVAGSVYALLAVSDVLDARNNTNGDESPESCTTWFMRAAHLAQLATAYEKLTSKGEMRVPDRPYSLYEGTAGMCCAWAEVLRRIDEMEGAGRGMPGYDDLPPQPE